MEVLFPERSFRRVYDAEQAAASAQVLVRPFAGGHEARVKVLSPRSGERILFEQDPSCRGLGDALAVAFAMLIEPRTEQSELASDTLAPPSAPMAAEAPSQQQPPLLPSRAASPTLRHPTAAAAPAPPKPAAASHQPKEAGNRGTPEHATFSTQPEEVSGRTVGAARLEPAFTTHAHGGVTGGLQILSRPNRGVRLGADLFHRSGFGLELTFLGIWAMQAMEGRGSISVNRFGAMLGLCYERSLWQKAHYLFCAEFGLGSQNATTRGFAEVYQPNNHDPWAVLGPKLGYVHELTDWLSLFVASGVSTDLMRVNYRVSGGLELDSHLLGLSAEAGFRLAGPRF
jgi:hypothetical protein